MIRRPLIAALTVALMGTSAMAAPAGTAGAPPSDAQAAPNNSDYDRDAPPSGDASPPGNAGDAPPPPTRMTEKERADRDLFCRRDAAARTGYTTPGQAARDEQAKGTIGGTVAGAALGAIIGGAGRHGNAGTGAAIGAGAGLLAGTAVGAANARQAASDVERDYAAAYYACMDEADAGPPPAGAGYAYGAPPPAGYAYPPPPYYYGPYPYPYYYPPYYYGPSVYFGFGGGWRGGWHHR